MQMFQEASKSKGLSPPLKAIKYNLNPFLFRNAANTDGASSTVNNFTYVCQGINK